MSFIGVSCRYEGSKNCKKYLLILFNALYLHSPHETKKSVYGVCFRTFSKWFSNCMDKIRGIMETIIFVDITLHNTKFARFVSEWNSRKPTKSEFRKFVQEINLSYSISELGIKLNKSLLLWHTST